MVHLQGGCCTYINTTRFHGILKVANYLSLVSLETLGIRRQGGLAEDRRLV